MTWNLPTIILGLVVLAGFVAIVAGGIRRRRRGGHSCSCGGGCSGCACSALMLSAVILPKIASGEWKKVLFVPTGALLSTVSYNEGKSVPGIAHGVILEGKES